MLLQDKIQWPKFQECSELDIDHQECIYTTEIGSHKSELLPLLCRVSCETFASSLLPTAL
jgi:hypothetical protein